MSAVMLLLVLGVVPLVRRWTARETTIVARREQWIRLEALASGEPQLRRALDTLRMSQQAAGTRLVTGTTAALAASNLQVLLQRYADESAVQLDRVDAVSTPETDRRRSGLVPLPLRLQGHGDVYGLVDFLYRLGHGEKLLVTDELVINAGPETPAGTQSLTWSIRLHGLHPEGGGR